VNLSEVLATAIHPALALLPAKMETDAACVMLLAIGLQESRFEHREQVGGPAHGFWQFEKSGVAGVLGHSETAQYADLICAAQNVLPAIASVYVHLATDDVLAAGFARLLLWTDPAQIPTDADGAWRLYLRTWRPGKPRRETWDGFFAQARAAIGT
jgi:hypothetical protein